MKKINPTIQANYLNEFNYENRKKKKRERERISSPSLPAIFK
jgi:hypothetical protein